MFTVFFISWNFILRIAEKITKTANIRSRKVPHGIALE